MKQHPFLLVILNYFSGCNPVCKRKRGPHGTGDFPPVVKHSSEGLTSTKRGKRLKPRKRRLYRDLEIVTDAVLD